MAKAFQRKNGSKYVLLQIRVSLDQMARIRVLCANLGITAQEFIKRLINAMD